MDRHCLPWDRGALAHVSAQVVCVQSWRGPWWELVVAGFGGVGFGGMRVRGTSCAWRQLSDVFVLFALVWIY
jgi:hypothetical protein